jgi:capsular polysaccharide biosynthesis protein
MKEFSPLDEFYRLFRTWWLIAICMLLGVLAAFVFHINNPPLYEATTTIMATIDLQTFPFHNVREDLIQYNEDMALGTVEGALRSPEVTQALFFAAQTQGVPLDSITLAQQSTIERKHAIWEVRYRDSDPITAQTVVNLWMEIGTQAMHTWQTDGRMPAFVILEDPTPAYLPAEPIAYQLSNLLLAGSAAGFILGVMITALVAWPKSNPTDAA